MAKITPELPPTMIMIPVLKNHFVIAATLFLCSLFVRTWGTGGAPMHPDEAHWVKRSEKVIDRLRRDPLDTTTHLGHPGIVPALVMASSQAVASRYNATRNIQWDHPGFIDQLTASRVSLAVITSLIPPILFLGAAPVIGLAGASLGAGMLAFDPHLIETSRLAHLDAMLALFVLVTALLYFEGRQSGKVRTTLVAGLFWGLALATKIAGVLVVPGLIVWNFVEWLRNRRTPPIQWRDVGCALVGVATLSLLWTRLWHHDGDFKTRLQIKSRIARLTYEGGVFLAAYWYVIPVVFAVLFLLQQRLGGRYRSHLVVVGVLATLFAAVPQVFENYIRFAIFSAGFSSIPHQGFAGVIPAPPLRYLGLALSFLPPIPLFGLVVGIGFLMAIVFKGSKAPEAPILTLSLTLIVTWCGLLSISPKEGWRYAVPVLSFMYLIAGYGIVTLLAKVMRPESRGTSVCCTAALVIHLLGTLSIAPRYETYSNPLTTDTRSMMALHQLNPLSGQNELVEVLLKEAEKGSASVAILGDGPTIEAAVQRRNPVLGKRLLFRYLHPESSDFFLAMPAHPPYPHPWSDFSNAPPIFRETFAGSEIIALYRVPPPEYREPFPLPLGTMSGDTGKIVEIEKSGPLGIEAYPEIHKAGNLVRFPIGIRSPKSSISIKIRATTPSTTPDDVIVGSFSLARSCKRNLRGRDLREEFQFTCKAPLPTKLAPLFSWNGKYPIRIESISLRAAE